MLGGNIAHQNGSTADGRMSAQLAKGLICGGHEGVTRWSRGGHEALSEKGCSVRCVVHDGSQQPNTGGSYMKRISIANFLVLKFTTQHDLY